jgi:hypothetical protein
MAIGLQRLQLGLVIAGGLRKRPGLAQRVIPGRFSGSARRADGHSM